MSSVFYPKENLDFAIFYDIEGRDLELCNSIASHLQRSGRTAKVFQLKFEKQIFRNYSPAVLLINKPHFYYPHRLMRVFTGTKYIILDTEGIYGSENFQNILFEPDGYIHWFSHQASRYNFKRTQTAVVGYPRRDYIKKVRSKFPLRVSLATNFSAIGYSREDLARRGKERKLRFKNDWDIFDYYDFQKRALAQMKTILKENPDVEFIIKPHPNDSKSLWENISLSKNTKIIDATKPISSLFEYEPSLHLCMDGCTTIIDAHIAGIDVVTFERFSSAKNSKLRLLELANLMPNESQSLTRFLCNNTHKNNLSRTPMNEEDILFLKELSETKFRLILQLCANVLENPKVLRLYNLPGYYHLAYWLKFFARKLIGKENKGFKREKLKD